MFDQSSRRRKSLKAVNSLSRSAVTILCVVVVNFVLMQMLPGDAAEVLAAESGSGSASTVIQLRQHFGLDRSVLEQFFAYLSNLAQLSLGVSPRFNLPVTELILSRLGNTLLLLLSAMGIALSSGVIAGVVMAANVGRWPDRLLSLLALLLYSVPAFWLGLMAIVFFAVKLEWLPTGGIVTVSQNNQGWDAALDICWHLVLPCLTLASFYVAIFARLTRSAMLEISQQDFVRTARAKGAGPLRVLLVHMLRNALVPVSTVAGMHFGALMGGALVIEVVFSWPGMGQLAMDSVMARDYSVVLGILLLASVLVIIANGLVDALHAWLDPRIAQD
ncbi:putative peptide transport system permease protein [Pseudomonas reidholzensis]|uniref:Putative peptide transport system permease protein n=1 Tax=Pseudomonas reidholzensis TaxID=1785162 RepID=A0A383RXL7_9PSED|nr:ABC transporter permease [Pseudomonas reidholzensis]SYX91782.1 putative peptide transport system permease protein [Pseudomonas reidholzensis]